MRQLTRIRPFIVSAVERLTHHKGGPLPDSERAAGKYLGVFQGDLALTRGFCPLSRMPGLPAVPGSPLTCPHREKQRCIFGSSPKALQQFNNNGTEFFCNARPRPRARQAEVFPICSRANGGTTDRRAGGRAEAEPEPGQAKLYHLPTAKRNELRLLD